MVDHPRAHQPSARRLPHGRAARAGARYLYPHRECGPRPPASPCAGQAEPVSGRAAASVTTAGPPTTPPLPPLPCRNPNHATADRAWGHERCGPTLPRRMNPHPLIPPGATSQPTEATYPYDRRYASTASTRRLSSGDGAMPSLSKTLAVCLATALPLMCRVSEMAAFDLPSAISSRTSRSRGVSPATVPLASPRFSSFATTCGSITVPPAATWRTASVNCSVWVTRSFSRYPTAPSPPASSSWA